MSVDPPASRPPKQPDPLPCTGARLRKLTRRVTSFYEQHMRASGLKLSQYSVLMNVTAAPQTLLELAARLDIDRTTLTRNLKPLLANGWIAEAPGGDARQRRLTLTPSGQRVRERAQIEWSAAQVALEQHLGRAFVAGLNSQLERALEQIKPALAEDN